ncbi:outer membrane protein assembly factor BamD [Roseiconus lacunae]|uniref:hypothetical protein n=1 Tax=Roseiconus lacunae TaxID=2605694 RepID=UPI001E5A1E62|nr:hypothetical protein [Roseiconus lacunae]MCD0458760.1 hypothetical protein [Roseiconus lacunae]
MRDRWIDHADHGRFCSFAAWVCLMCCGLLATGCATASKQVVVEDKTLDRYVTNAHEAFHEGRVQEAEKNYRKVLLRAWATDDPYESGTAAYNLAACLVSQSELAAASDWLVDARVELSRAGASAGNTWLLSAEIAMTEGRLADAECFVSYASSTRPPCEIVDTCCLCGPSEECCRETDRDCCAASLPCLSKDVEQERAKVECQQAYQARIELARARIAIKQMMVDEAERHLGLACRLAEQTCDFSLHADRHDVAAEIHDAKQQFLQAGAHRDREAKLLRCIGHYRAIPSVLVAASDSYAFAGRFDLAVDRLIRAARIGYARSEFQRAWGLVRRASEWGTACGCEAAEIRLALTAKQIRDALQDQMPEPMDSDPAMITDPSESRQDGVKSRPKPEFELELRSPQAVPPPPAQSPESFSPENPELDLKTLLETPTGGEKTADRASAQKWRFRTADLPLPMIEWTAMLAPHKIATDVF